MIFKSIRYQFNSGVAFVLKMDEGELRLVRGKLSERQRSALNEVLLCNDIQKLKIFGVKKQQDIFLDFEGALDKDIRQMLNNAFRA